MAEDLRKYSVSEEEWEEYLEQRQSRVRSGDFIPEFIQIEGVRPELEPRVEEALAEHLNRPIDLDWGRILPLDRIFSQYNPSAHITEDFFNNLLCAFLNSKFEYDKYDDEIDNILKQHYEY